MHSHDRTLLARLGFADPDKKDPRHDWACQYLAQNEVALRVLRSLYAGPKWRDHVVKGRRHEAPITKGEGQYKVTVGFADLLLWGSASKRACAASEIEDWWFEELRLLVEVKIAATGVAEVVRQIGLYREYLPGAACIVVTAYPVVPADVETLRLSGIRHLKLGADFESYCAARQAVRLADVKNEEV